MRKEKHQRRWDREEVIILVGEYFKNKNLSTKEIDKSYYDISEFLRKREEIKTGMAIDDIFRNYAGIKLQTGRVRSLDPDTDLSGMQGTKLQKEIVSEYLSNPQGIFKEMEMIYEKYNR